MKTLASPFAGDYRQARRLFQTAAQAAGGQLGEIPHPGTGPHGEKLAVDVAWLGPGDAPRVLLCLSGVHGAEGYAGSGAQVAWLATRPVLPADTAVLMVHGINPWGFAYGLRGTEDNIDLNRNWLDHARPHPPNPLYAELHPHLCPRDLSRGAIDAMVEAGERLAARYGQWAIEDAISRGQYTHPDGYHFGGTAPAWATRALASLVTDRLAAARRIAYVDLHSGPVGDGETIFLCFSRPGSTERARAAAWWGAEALDPGTVDRQWGSRRPTRHGIVFWGVERLLAGRAALAGAVVEFCSAAPRSETRHPMRIPMLERWLRFEGGLDAPEAPAYLAEIRENYAPRRADWEARVAAAGTDVLTRSLQGLGCWD